MEASRVASKQMAGEKRSNSGSKADKVRAVVGEIVCSAWKHAAAKAGLALRASLNTKDELCHLDLFTQMHHDHKAENPEVYTPAFYEKARQLIKNAVALETTWGLHMIEGGVLGLSPAVMENNPQHLADIVCGRIGIEPIYGVKTLVPWAEQYMTAKNNKRNFFETRVVDYTSGGLDWGDGDE